MTETVTLQAQPRTGTGKGAARATRRAGDVPCVIYGNNKAPVSISLNGLELNRELKNPAFFTTLYNVELDGKKNQVLVRDVQFHPVSDDPLHVDFLRVSATSTVTVMLPVHFINQEESKGLKRGGVLNIVRHEVEVTCPANAIPEYLEADVAGFDIGESVHISNANLPKGVTPTITDRDFTLATLTAPSALREKMRTEGEAAEGEDSGETTAEDSGDTEEE